MDLVIEAGYIYTVEDLDYTDFIKIGCTTNIPKRLKAYNTDRPFNRVRLLCVSKKFIDVRFVEKQILLGLKEIGVLPIANRAEWFQREHEPKLVNAIIAAEKDLITIRG